MAALLPRRCHDSRLPLTSRHASETIDAMGRLTGWTPVRDWPREVVIGKAPKGRGRVSIGVQQPISGAGWAILLDGQSLANELAKLGYRPKP